LGSFFHSASGFEKVSEIDGSNSLERGNKQITPIALLVIVSTREQARKTELTEEQVTQTLYQ